MISVFIVDDHPMVIEGLSAMLGGHDDVSIIGIATNGALCRAFLSKHDADIVLMDINLPDVSGIDLCNEIKKRYPKVYVIGLSNFDQLAYVESMRAGGASGYVLKNASSTELLTAIRTIHKGGKYWDPELIKGKSDTNEKIMSLTRREKEILILIADGLTNNEIGEKIFLSPLTIDSHRKNILSKLQVKNTAAMVRFAVENGLI